MFRIAQHDGSIAADRAALIPVRVVLIFPGALGDLCLLAPAVTSLTADGARVAISVQRALMPLAAALVPGATLGPPADGTAMSSLFGGDLAPELAEWLTGADRLHAWLGSATTGAALRASLAPVSVRVVEVHAVVRNDGPEHASMAYARAIRVTKPLQPARLVLGDAPAAWAWRRPGAPRLVLHPGAGARAKCWSRDGVRCLAETWTERDGEVVLLLGPAEEEDRERWRASGQPTVPGLTLLEAAGLIATASYWVGNDSGMSHVAGALDRGGVVLYGPTRPQRWRPLGGRLSAVSFADAPTDVVVRRVLRELDRIARALA